MGRGSEGAPLWRAPCRAPLPVSAAAAAHHCPGRVSPARRPRSGGHGPGGAPAARTSRRAECWGRHMLSLGGSWLVGGSTARHRLAYTQLVARPAPLPLFAVSGPGLGFPGAGRSPRVDCRLAVSTPLGRRRRRPWDPPSPARPLLRWLGLRWQVRLGTFFDIQNRLLLLTSKIQTGYSFFHHI